MKVEKVRIDSLKLDAGNVRLHPEKNLAAIKASLKRFGQQRPIIVGPGDVVHAGNGTLQALREMGSTQVLIVRTDLKGEELRAFAVADNRTAELAAWDTSGLSKLLKDLGELEGTGFDTKDLDHLLRSLDSPTSGKTAPNAIPELGRKIHVKPGDLFELGRHRLLCGDSTAAGEVARLCAGEVITLIHADPPYGMGKEKDGVANDNLYAGKLDAFQLRWWQAWASQLHARASAYIWGQAEDLWRLWWKAGLHQLNELQVRNELIWNKQHGQGMNTEAGHSFASASERCLFLMRGIQALGNQNVEDYWPGYEPLRSWLEAELERAGMTIQDANRITATKMGSHWFTKSQFLPIGRPHYEKLKAAASGRAFDEPYDAIFSKLFPGLREAGERHRKDLAADLRKSRSYFDNRHDTMSDVWEFPRVEGEERFGHATPKPVEMVTRAIRSSSSLGDPIGAPFSGTGPELIAAEMNDRRCFAMELEPAYVQVAVERWEAFTGKKAKRERRE